MEQKSRNDTVKLIVEIPKELHEALLNGYEEPYSRMFSDVVKNGTLLDNNSERAEVQSYFAGEAYGWEQGRKALIDDLKAEIETNLSWDMFDEYGNETALHKELWGIIDNVGKENGT